MSANISQQTLPQKAADDIIRLIQIENYATGAKLPNEYDLSRMLNVSRNTVREAIKLLVSRNVLEVRRGAGTFVSAKQGLGDDPLGLSMIADKKQLWSDILHLQLLIEPRSAALAAQYAAADEIRQLQLFLPDSKNSAEQFYSHNDVAFHLQIACCSRNLVVHNIYTALYNKLMQTEVPDIIAADSPFIACDHHKIYDAIANHNACAAHDAMQAHLLHLQEYLEKLFLHIAETR
ncbi:MAG: GntR family transcriptional regulator [Lachnospiraceae bacterium]|nr:GntR family transcriptional regulator [Lachnospiraceae bacterium]